MNLDLVPLGWMHFAASVVALVLGLVMLLGPKGTAVHKGRGRVYVLAILVTSLTAFGIYRLGQLWLNQPEVANWGSRSLPWSACSARCIPPSTS